MFSDQTARALTWWPDQVLDCVSRRVQAAWQTWNGEWVPEPQRTQEPVTARRAHEGSAERADQHWSPLGCRGAARAWITSPSPRVLGQVQALLFAGVASGREHCVADAVAQRAFGELSRTLRSCLQLAEAPQTLPQAWLFSPWSGAVHLHLPIAGGGLDLLLGPECVEAMPQATTGTSNGKAVAKRLVAVHEAVSSSQIKLEVRLGELEIELGTLAQLADGDVLPLPQRLGEPLTLTAPDGEAVLRGFLGRRDQHKAIQLISAGSPSATAL